MNLRASLLFICFESSFCLRPLLPSLNCQRWKVQNKELNTDNVKWKILEPNATLILAFFTFSRFGAHLPPFINGTFTHACCHPIALWEIKTSRTVCIQIRLLFWSKWELNNIYSCHFCDYLSSVKPNPNGGLDCRLSNVPFCGTGTVVRIFSRGL